MDIEQSTHVRQTGVICGLLVCLTVLAYVPTFQNDFVNFDDPVYASENPFVAAGLAMQSVRYAWTTCDLGNRIPLTWHSLQLDATLFGVNATAFHATNLLLHVESVAGVAERKNVLCPFWLLLTLIAYERYVAQLQAQQTRTARPPQDQYHRRQS